MKKIIAILALAAVCVTAAAQTPNLEKKARGDANKVVQAAGLNKEQGEKVYQFQLQRYNSIDSLKTLNLPEADFKKQSGKVNNAYQKRVEGIMTQEQVAAFKAWKAEKAKK